MEDPTREGLERSTYWEKVYLLTRLQHSMLCATFLEKNPTALIMKADYSSLHAAFAG